MPKNENPLQADLEVVENNRITLAQEKSTPVEDIAKAIELLLDKYPDKNTKLTPEQEEGLIILDVIQAHMKKSFEYEFPSLIALKESKQDHALSVEGFRFEKIIEVFKSIQTNIISGDTPSLRSKLLGR